MSWNQTFLFGWYEGIPSRGLPIPFLITVSKKLESSEVISKKILKSEVWSAYLGVFTKPGGQSPQKLFILWQWDYFTESLKHRELAQIPKMTYNVNIHFYILNTKLAFMSMLKTICMIPFNVQNHLVSIPFYSWRKMLRQKGILLSHAASQWQTSTPVSSPLVVNACSWTWEQEAKLLRDFWLATEEKKKKVVTALFHHWDFFSTSPVKCEWENINCIFWSNTGTYGGII